MAEIFDEADFRRRLEAEANVSTTDELRFIASGDLNALKAHELAKQAALRQARKQILRAILEKETEQRLNGFLPAEVEQIVTGRSDDIIKV